MSETENKETMQETPTPPAKGGMINMPIIPKKDDATTPSAPGGPSGDSAESASVDTARHDSAESSIAQKAVIANYEVDVANAMSQTDASQIQKFIQRAKDDEAEQKERAVRNTQGRLLSTVAVLCLIGAIGGFVYGAFHFKSLTVPLAPNVSLGAFPTFSAKIQTSTPLPSVLETISKDTTFVVGRPMLVDIVDSTGTLVSPKELFTYLGIKATEPLQTSFVVARYGFVKISDTQVIPFIVGATADQSIATKEFLIGESSMLRLFGDAFMLDQSKIAAIAGGGFSQEVVYNIPVRILRAQKDDQRQTTLAYGFPTENVVVFTTNTQVFDLVENVLLGQY